MRPTDLLPKGKAWPSIIKAVKEPVGLLALALLMAGVALSTVLLIHEPLELIAFLLVIVLMAWVAYLVIPLAVGSKGPEYLGVDFGGEWKYEIVSLDKTYSHGGQCRAYQTGRNIRITGVREWVEMTAGDGKQVRETAEVSWSSSWAQVCEDGIVRMEYNFNLPNGKVQAFCQMNPKDKRRQVEGRQDRQYGTLYLLGKPHMEATMMFWRPEGFEARRP